MKHSRQATVQEDDDSEVAGPTLPTEETEELPDDDDEGRFFGGGITKDTADVLDFIDERDNDEAAVGFFRRGPLISC